MGRPKGSKNKDLSVSPKADDSSLKSSVVEEVSMPEALKKSTAYSLERRGRYFVPITYKIVNGIVDEVIYGQEDFFDIVFGRVEEMIEKDTRV